MPNHVKSKLEIIGEKEKTLEVMSHLKGEPFDDGAERTVDFNKIKPMPAELSIGSCSTPENHAELALRIRPNNGNPLIDALHASNLARASKDSPLEMNDENWDIFIQMMQNYRKHGYFTWYQWCQKEWGTKWNAYSFGDGRDTETVVYFETAWSAPKELMRLLSEQFPDVKISLTWADEDTGSNAGRMEFQAGNEIEKFEPESQSKKAYDIAFEMRPDYKEDYQLIGGQYEYIEDDG